MKYIFENSLKKKGINQKLEKELKKFWKKKRISCTDHRDYLAFFKSLPYLFWQNIIKRNLRLLLNAPHMVDGDMRC